MSETLTIKRARLAQELEDIRISKARVLRAGQNVSSQGMSMTWAQIEYLDRREAVLEKQIQNIDSIKAGKGGITPGIAIFRGRSDRTI